jgi:rubredoxin
LDDVDPEAFDTRPCPTCEAPMTFTGLPNLSGPIYVRIYRCPTCGYVRVPVDTEESPEGWG